MIVVIVMCLIIDWKNIRILGGSFLFRYLMFLENIFRIVFLFLVLNFSMGVLSSVDIVLLWICLDDLSLYVRRNKVLMRSNSIKVFISIVGSELCWWFCDRFVVCVNKILKVVRMVVKEILVLIMKGILGCVWLN